ncbi:MAG: D-glycero-beta-D-manno-heptose 1-phosphate adenylyltransferase [candidate division Zixibacteria bacterium]|nr:D-glycero-beta-D-manno-heptose 1-phosphate adenylyltransferase [candidate division Zixibacteria bacterium]
MPIDRLIPRGRAASLATRLHRTSRRIVFTNGVFDILHRGHVEYLTKARSFGDLLIVGLNRDSSVRKIKGPSRPYQKERDRAAVLLGLRAVDYVILFSEETPDLLIRALRPDVLVKGADYRESEIVGAEFVRSYGGSVRRVRLTPGRSTTSILKRMSRAGKKR